MTAKPTEAAPAEQGYRYRWHEGHAPVLFESIRVAGLSDQEHLERESPAGVRVDPGEEFTAAEHINHPYALPLSPDAKKAAKEIERQFVSGAE